MPNFKNMPKKKKIILMVSCIVVVLVIVIVTCVIVNNSKKEKESSLADESEYLVQSTDSYEGLNYTLTDENIVSESYFYDLDRGIDGSKIDVTFKKVSGLRDDTLEEKINETLKEEAESLYDTSSLQNGDVLYDHVYNYTDVYIFNNVLSTMYCRELCDIEGNISYEYRGVNINLKEYVPFSFKDIFINTTDLSTVVSNDVLNQVLDNTCIFSLSPKEIYVYNDVKKEVERINLYKHKEYVAIYKRYSENKKLFEKTYNSTPYVFTTKKFFETDSYGLVDNNIFIDTVNKYVDEREYSSNVMDALNTLYKSAVSASKNKAYSNPSKRYLAQIIPNIEKENDNVLNLNVTYTIFEIEKDFFNENIEEFVVASENRVEDEDTKIDYFNNPVMDAGKYLLKTETEMIEKKVDINGEEIVEEGIIDNNLIEGES